MNAAAARPAGHEENLLGLRILAGLIDNALVLGAFFIVRATLLSGYDPSDGAVPRLPSLSS